MADDLLNSLLDDMNNDNDDRGSGGSDLESLLDVMGAASGSGAEPGGDMMGGLAGLLGGGGAGGGMAGMLGSLLGGGSSGGSSPMGGLLGGGGGADLSQMPIVGSIINSLAEKFGIPPAQASALVMAAISMLLSKKDRSGGLDVDRVAELDVNSIMEGGLQHSDILAQAAQEAGLDDEKASAGVQDALQMLLDAMQ